MKFFLFFRNESGNVALELDHFHNVHLPKRRWKHSKGQKEAITRDSTGKNNKISNCTVENLINYTYTLFIVGNLHTFKMFLFVLFETRCGRYLYCTDFLLPAWLFCLYSEILLFPAALLKCFCVVQSVEYLCSFLFLR